MNFGAYKHRLLFKVQQESRDLETNEVIVTYVPFYETWGDVKDVLMSQAERLANNINLSQQPAKVRIRYLEGLVIKTDAQIIVRNENDRKLIIVSGPSIVGDKSELEFMAVTYSAEGQGA